MCCINLVLLTKSLCPAFYSIDINSKSSETLHDLGLTNTPLHIDRM